MKVQPTTVSKINNLLAETIGEASLQWDNISGAGVYQSTKSVELLERTSKKLQEIIEEDTCPSI